MDEIVEVNGAEQGRKFWLFREVKGCEFLRLAHAVGKQLGRRVGDDTGSIGGSPGSTSVMANSSPCQIHPRKERVPLTGAGM